MSKKFIFILLFLLIAGFLGWYFYIKDKNMPPACDDKNVKLALNESVMEYLNDIGVKNINLTITDHEEHLKLKESKEYICEARIILSNTNKRIKSEIIKYSVFLDKSNENQFSIQIDE